MRTEHGVGTVALTSTKAERTAEGETQRGAAARSSVGLAALNLPDTVRCNPTYRGPPTLRRGNEDASRTPAVGQVASGGRSLQSLLGRWRLGGLVQKSEQIGVDPIRIGNRYAVITTRVND